MSEPRFVADTLAWCNERRQEQGQSALKRLPLGQRGNGRSCPCGVATGMFVGASFYSPDEHTTLGLPPAVTQFVIEFGNGNLPQYDMDVAA